MKGIAYDVENLMQIFKVHITHNTTRALLTGPIGAIHIKFSPPKIWRTFIILMDSADTSISGGCTK